jgi:hypothetical protein
MGINYENLDDTTRNYSLEEIQMGGHYISPRLTEEGQAAWPSLLEEAHKSHNDDWIAKEILSRGYMRSHEKYKRQGVERVREINKPHAAQQLAEGEFNRYYIRGLCLRAKAAGKDSLIVYRGKHVSNPRPESEIKIGTSVPVDALLAMLRSNDFVSIDECIGVPSGPNSGLTCKLPQ